MNVRVIPDHVPAELVFDFDYATATHNVPDPYAPLMDLDARGVPDFFYSPLLGGHWVARRYDTVREIFQDHERFTTFPIVIPPIKNQPTQMIPLQVDPPHHQRYRRIMGPLFTPAAARSLEGVLRATAAELIEPLVGLGQVDFVRAYAHKYPPLVFLRFMGMPTGRMDEFVQWAADSLVGTPEQQSTAGAKIIAFVTQFIDAKYAGPGLDWASKLIAARPEDGSPALTREEVINITYFLFLAGLDTVLNSMSHAWRYLATTPDAQARLAADASAIPNAVEELLRFNVITNNSRRVREDMDYRGIKLKKGDPVLLLVAVANREENPFPGGNSVDLERRQNLHLTFGLGIHRCIGSNLARAELRISLEEWLKRIPPFRLQEGADVRSVGGVTMGLQTLPLVWTPKS